MQVGLEFFPGLRNSVNSKVSKYHAGVGVTQLVIE